MVRYLNGIWIHNKKIWILNCKLQPMLSNIVWSLPFEYWIFKSSVFRWIWYSGVWYSDGYCIQILTVVIRIFFPRKFSISPGFVKTYTSSADSYSLSSWSLSFREISLLILLPTSSSCDEGRLDESSYDSNSSSSFDEPSPDLVGANLNLFVCKKMFKSIGQIPEVVLQWGRLSGERNWVG